MRTRYFATILLSAGLLLGLAGCDDGEPEGTPGTPTQPQTPTSAGLETVQACGLVNDTEAASISEGIAAEDMGAGSGATSGCQWSTSIDRGVRPDVGVVFSINVRPSQSIDEAAANGGQLTDGDVEGRPAKQIAASSGIEGSCFLTFTVGTGRIDINVERASQPTDKACDDASKISTLIEPKLPK